MPESPAKLNWGVMSFYERFEHMLALVLSGVISVIICEHPYDTYFFVTVESSISFHDPLETPLHSG